MQIAPVLSSNARALETSISCLYRANKLFPATTARHPDTSLRACASPGRSLSAVKLPLRGSEHPRAEARAPSEVVMPAADEGPAGHAVPSSPVAVAVAGANVAAAVLGVAAWVASAAAERRKRS